MSSDATQFLQAILPDNGAVCIAHERSVPAVGRPTARWTQRFFSPKQAANGALVNHIKELNEHRDTNIYFGVATYAKQDRSASNVKAIQCVLLDIDLKGPRAHYKTKAEAVRGVAQLYKEVQCLPKPWIVDSGNGVHAYFTFDKPVTTAEWQVVANTFGKVAEAVDERLFSDPKPTVDAARVMRIPSTWNAKAATREYAKVMQAGEQGDFDKMKAGLASEAAKRKVWVKQQVPDNTPLLSGAPPAHAIGDTPALGQGFVEMGVRFTDLNPTPIATGCKQVARMMKLRGDVSEPEWILMLRVLNTCKNPDDLAHTFSAGHPSYTRSNTNHKLRHVRENFNSPSAGCEEFQAINPKYCEGCRFKGKVWTPSQIAEVAEQKEAKQSADKAATEKLVKNEKSEDGFLPLPLYYKQVFSSESREPMTTIPVYMGEEQGEVQRALITGHINVWGSSQRLDTDAKGRDTATDMMIHLNAKIWRRSFDLAIPASTLTNSSVDKATTQLREMGLVFHAVTSKELTALRKYFGDIVRVASHNPRPYYATKGWTPKGLTLGAIRFEAPSVIREGCTYAEHKRAGGTIVEQFCSGRPAGTLGEWKRAMKVFDGDHPYAHTVLLSGIANTLFPLMPGMQGGIVIALTGKSGVGKTTLMHFMNSFLGHPTEGVVQGTSTDKVMLDILKQSSVFMLPVDDMTSMSPSNLSALLSTVTSGRPRQRLEQRQDGSWESSGSVTLNASLMLTSNFSASGAFRSGKRTHDQLQLEAALTRQLEIPAHQTIVPEITSDHWSRAKAGIMMNNGHALGPFARYVVDNRQLVTKLLQDRERQFERGLAGLLHGTVHGQYRFWVRYLAAVVTAGEILKSLSLIDWNIKNIAAAGLKLAVEQQEETSEIQEDDMDVLWEILTNDDHGRININLSQYVVETRECVWPEWDAPDARSMRANNRQWSEQGKNNLFNQITNRVVNRPEWRIIATEVRTAGKLVAMERTVLIPITKLRSLVSDHRELSATVWEELYNSLQVAGCQIDGVEPGKPNKTTGFRGYLSTTQYEVGNGTRVVEITFPPITF